MIKRKPKRKEASRQKRVLIIAEELNKGTKTHDIHAIYEKKWQCKKRQIDRYISEAKAISDVQLQEKQDTINRIRREEIEKAAKDSIISDLEIEAYLCKIVKGDLMKKVTIKAGKTTEIQYTPDVSDVLKAADLLFKKRGSYAAEKINVSAQVTVSETQFSIRKRGESKA